jgi:hypothetical protein
MKSNFSKPLLKWSCSEALLITTPLPLPSLAVQIHTPSHSTHIISIKKKCHNSPNNSQQSTPNLQAPRAIKRTSLRCRSSRTRPTRRRTRRLTRARRTLTSTSLELVQAPSRSNVTCA